MQGASNRDSKIVRRTRKKTNRCSMCASIRSHNTWYSYWLSRYANLVPCCGKCWHRTLSCCSNERFRCLMCLLHQISATVFYIKIRPRVGGVTSLLKMLKCTYYLRSEATLSLLHFVYSCLPNEREFLQDIPRDIRLGISLSLV